MQKLTSLRVKTYSIVGKYCCTEGISRINCYHHFLLVWCRDSRALILRSLNEKVIGALQLNSLSKSADNASQKTSATKKQLDSVLSNKIETLNTCPVDENM